MLKCDAKQPLLCTRSSSIPDLVDNMSGRRLTSSFTRAWGRDGAIESTIQGVAKQSSTSNLVSRLSV